MRYDRDPALAQRGRPRGTGRRGTVSATTSTKPQAGQLGHETGDLRPPADADPGGPCAALILRTRRPPPHPPPPPPPQELPPSPPELSPAVPTSRRRPPARRRRRRSRVRRPPARAPPKTATDSARDGGPYVGNDGRSAGVEMPVDALLQLAQRAAPGRRGPGGNRGQRGRDRDADDDHQEQQEPDRLRSARPAATRAMPTTSTARAGTVARAHRDTYVCPS